MLNLKLVNGRFTWGHKFLESKTEEIFGNTCAWITLVVGSYKLHVSCVWADFYIIKLLFTGFLCTMPDFLIDGDYVSDCKLCLSMYYVTRHT